MLYLSISALIIFLTYVIVCLCLFGITHSLSETYYRFEDIKRNLGKILFYSMLVTVGLLTIISTVEKVGVFALLMVVGISMVGVFPEYEDTQGMDRILHPVGAGIAAISSIISVYIMLPHNIMYILFSFVFCCVAWFALVTKSLKRCYIYHLEMLAFYTLFGGSIIYNFLK